MKVFLCGGGAGDKTTKAYKKLNEVINHAKPILYIPLAMNPNKYDSCYEWITQELKEVDIPYIEMIRTKEELSEKDLNIYSAIFIGGGNTFKLLNELKQSGAFEKIKEYLDNDGIAFGGSAGAIIFGYNLKSCKLDDKNEVNLQDIKGFDILNYISILCHYTNRTKEKDEESKKYLLELSKENKIIALPEEDTLYYEDGKLEVIGNRPYYLFENGNIIEFNSKKDRKKELLEIKTPQELMNFMDTNITYGWLDKKEYKHLNNLNKFRENYIISNIDKVLETGYGTCIEQAKIIKYKLDELGYETRLYCHRSYETEKKLDKEIKMHCFVLFKDKENWYHFEHSNMLKKGIHKYNNIEEALTNITSGFKPVITLTEIPTIPDNLTFYEFNQYVNQFDKNILNNKGR